MSIKGISDSFSPNLPASPAVEPNAVTDPAAQQQDYLQNDFIVANSDVVEKVTSNPFDLLQQPKNTDLIHQSNIGIEAAPSNLDLTKIPQKTRLEELYDRLNKARERRDELKNQINDANKKKQEMEQVKAAIKKSLENDEPISESDLAGLSALGPIGIIAGILAGLPALSMISGIFFGLSEGYKQYLHEANAKLEQGMNDEDASIAKSQAELSTMSDEEKTILDLIDKEKQRLEQGFTEQNLDIDSITARTPWEEFVSPENMAESNSSTVPFNPNVEDIEK